MRTLALALTAASLTLPALPSAAVARSGYYQGRTWQDAQGRTRCRRPNGTTGLVGRAVDTHGERTTGNDIGAAAGALLGRHVERHRVRCR